MSQTYRIVVGDVNAVLSGEGLGLGGLFDAALSDPPYGLSFMAKGWDHTVPGPEVWTKVLSYLRPGASLLAFGGSRTFHRLTCAVEDGGFEIRDVLMWLYGSGFPKSHDISKGIDKAAGAEREVVGMHTYADGQTYSGGAKSGRGGGGIMGDPMPRPPSVETAPATPDAQRFDGYGTALKPAYEPIVWGMAPRDGSFANNATAHGVAGVNIDAGRVGVGDTVPGGGKSKRGSMGLVYGDGEAASNADPHNEGRWPANVILDEEAGAVLDEPSRFFYCPKASRKEREAGLDAPEGARANIHPTVKPLDLCRYLASMLLPPPREDEQPRRILVPFSGSGSEMIGCLLAGWDEVVGVEMSPEYAEIAHARLEHWERYRRADSETAAAESAGQQALF